MAVSDEFLEFLLDQFSGWGGVTARKMFGGAGLYRDGKMFGLIAGDVAYLKVDDSNRQDFVQAGAGPFKPYADQDVSMSYYEIPRTCWKTGKNSLHGHNGLWIFR